MIQLPYKNYKYTLNIILPISRKGLSKVEAKLAKVNLLDLDSALTSEYCAVSLPKFNVTQQIVLNDLLDEVVCLHILLLIY